MGGGVCFACGKCLADRGGVVSIQGIRLRLSNPDSSSFWRLAPVLHGGVRVGGSHSLVMLTRSVPGEWSRDLRISSLHQPLGSLVTWADSLSLFFPMTPEVGVVTFEGV